MESKAVIKNPEVIIEPFDSSSITKEYVLKVEDRCFKTDERLLKILLFVTTEKTIEELQEYLHQEFNEILSFEYITEFLEQNLIAKKLIVYKEAEVYQPIDTRKKKKSYIKLQISLFRFETIKFIIERLTFLFKKQILVILSILSFGVVCIIIVIYNKNDILKVNLSAFEYIIILMIIYIGTLWHEFGHFTSCYKYGITPKNIGFGLYIVFPVLFSDVTSIWLLSRKKRMVVNYAGIYFQLIYIVLLFCISFFIGKTLLLKTAYIIIISFIYTLNPILRFDGYWLFSDAIGIDNLREKTRQITNYKIARLLKKDVIRPSVLSEYANDKILFLRLYTFASFFFLCYFYYLISKEIFVIIQDVWKYFIILYNSNFSEFTFDQNFMNILVKLIIVVIFIYIFIIRLLKK